MTRDQMVQMKQNAHTLVTQLQYFHMHVLQHCLGRATTMFIQHHTLGGSSSFFDIRLSRALHILNLYPKKGNLNLG